MGNKISSGIVISSLLLTLCLASFGFPTPEGDGGGNPPSGKDMELLKKGELLFSQESFAEALDVFRLLEARFHGINATDYLHCRNRVAECLLWMDQSDNALKNYMDSTYSLCQALLEDINLETANALFNLGLYHSNNRQFPQAHAELNAALAIKRDLLSDNDPQVGRIYRLIGRLNRSEGQLQMALDNQFHSLRINNMQKVHDHFALGRNFSEISLTFQSIGIPDSVEKYLLLATAHAKLAKPNGLTLQKVDNFYYRGNYYLDRGNWEKAIELLDSSFSGYTALNVSPIRRGYALRRIGECYRNMGDYYKTLDYFQRNYQLIRDNYPLDEEINYAHTYNNLAAVYHNLGQNDKCFEYLLKSLKVLKGRAGGVIEGNITFFPAYLNLGETLLNLQRYEQAKPYLDSALMALPPGGGNSKKEAALRVMMGTYWTYKANQAEAKKEFSTAIRQYQKEKASGAEFSGVYLQFGKMNMQFGDIPAALNLFDLGLQAICIPNPGKDQWGNPLREGIRDKSKAFELLSAKANAMKMSDVAENKEGALNTFLLAFEILDEMRANFQAEGSKIIQSSTAYPAYERAINLAIELFQATGDRNYFDQAFTLSERCKSLVLLEGVSAKKAMSYAGVPDTLVQREQSIDIETAYYERKLQEAQQSGSAEPAVLEKLQDQIFKGKREKEELYKTMKAQYPEYYRLRYSINIAKPSTVRMECLDESGALIEYFLGDSTLVIFGLRKDADTVVIQKIDSAFHSRLLGYRKYLSGFDLSRQAWESYAADGNALYNLLIAPVRKFIKGNRLTIIPDGPLGYISFETLLTSPVDASKEQRYKSLPYLLRDFALSYDYSATLLNEKKKNTKPRPSYSYLLMAPEFGPGLNPLPGAASFAQKIEGQFNNTLAMSGAEATKANFEREAPNYDIIHLATHALIDDGQPLYSKFVFSSRTPSGEISNDSLFTFELYGMKLKARLAILDGCSTGGGKLQRGEGVMSLARAFSYIGCPSIVMTLWEEADEKSTPMIMSAFFENLSDGLPLDLAMQKAKIRFLDEIDISNHAHPSLWSELVVIGETSPVPLERRSGSWLPWISLGIIIVGGFGFMWAWKRRNRAA